MLEHQDVVSGEERPHVGRGDVRRSADAGGDRDDAHVGCLTGAHVDVEAEVADSRCRRVEPDRKRRERSSLSPIDDVPIHRSAECTDRILQCLFRCEAGDGALLMPECSLPAPDRPRGDGTTEDEQHRRDHDRHGQR
jgi:hypothetical protein